MTKIKVHLYDEILDIFCDNIDRFAFRSHVRLIMKSLFDRLQRWKFICMTKFSISFVITISIISHSCHWFVWWWNHCSNKCAFCIISCDLISCVKHLFFSSIDEIFDDIEECKNVKTNVRSICMWISCTFSNFEMLIFVFCKVDLMFCFDQMIRNFDKRFRIKKLYENVNEKNVDKRFQWLFSNL